MQLIKIESYKKGIVYSTFFNFLTKIIGFTNNLFVAYFFGTQLKSDVYFYCFATLSVISSFITNINGVVIIPECMRIRNISEKEGMNFVNFFFSIYVLIGLIVTIVLYLIPVESFIFFSKFDKNVLENNIDILFYIIPYFIFFVLTSFLLDVLTSYKYFTLPMLVSILTNLLSLIFMISFRNLIGISSIALGVSLSYFINTVILIIILVKQLKWKFFLSSFPLNRKMIKNLFYTILSNVTTVLGSYLPLYLISGFNGGIITALNYGRNLATIPDQFITTQFSSILGIKLNEIYSKRTFDELNNAFLSSINILFFILIPIATFFFFFSNEIIFIVYKRGAFNLASVQMTSFFFKYFALTLPFLAINTATTRLFSASQRLAAGFFSGVVINILFIFLLYLYITKYGPNGYPFAVLTYLPVSVLGWNLYLCRKIFPEIAYILVLKSFFKISILNIIIVLPIYFLHQKCLTNSNHIITILICGFIYLIALLLINLLLKVNKDVYDFQKQILSNLK